VPLSHVDLEIAVDVEAGLVRIEGTASTVSGTGVEMEALTACSVAALTLYDMVKGIERGVSIEKIQLIEKSGGKSGWQRRD
jgi:cyclic pyranopterin phosphate synthase